MKKIIANIKNYYDTQYHITDIKSMSSLGRLFIYITLETLPNFFKDNDFLSKNFELDDILYFSYKNVYDKRHILFHIDYVKCLHGKNIIELFSVDDDVKKILTDVFLKDIDIMICEDGVCKLDI